MKTVAPSAVFKVQVTAFNAGGKSVPLPADLAVAAVAGLATVALDPSGLETVTAGTVDGTDALVASSAAVKSDPYPFTVADNVVAKLVIADAA